MNTSSNPILLFDGVCNLCNGTVQFIIQRDHKAVFRFASLQSDIGKKLLAQHHLPIEAMNTLVLIQDDKAYTRSTAALKVAAHLGLYWFWTQLLWVFPTFIRDFVYNFVAKNRYHWFGKQESCMLPKPEWKERFLA